MTTNNDKPDYLEIFFLFLILALALLLRLAFVHVPLDRDEGQYGYIGQEILRGVVPYLGAFDIKPPGVFYIYAAIIALFGSTVEAVRLATAGYSLLTVIGIYLTVRYCHGKKAGIAAALFYAIFSSGPIVEGSGSNTEVFMMLPMVAACYLFLRWLDARKVVLLLASGCCAALAGIIKTVALPLFILVICFIVVSRRTGEKPHQTIWNIAVFIAPSCFLLLALYLYLAANNAWDEFIYWNITFNKQYGQTSLAEFVSRLTGRGLYVSSEHVLLWLLAVPTAIWLVVRRRDPKNLFLALLIPFTFLGVAMPGKFWAHYFIPMIAPLSIVAGIGMVQLINRRGWLLYASLPFLSAAFLYSVAMDYKFYLVYSPQEISTRKFQSPVFVTAANVASYIKARTTPTDYIFQWGWEPEIYFLANRRCPNRIVCHLIVEASKNPMLALNEMMTSIIYKQPKYIVVQAGREEWFGYLELSEIIAQAYHLEMIIDGFSIYRINNA